MRRVKPIHVIKWLCHTAFGALMTYSVLPAGSAFGLEPFDEAYVLAELNDTDGDIGFHALIDGGPWKSLDIKAPNGRVLLGIRNKSALQKQGLTELFFESAEPTFDEVSPEEFFRRFPEGNYSVGARTLEGERLRSVLPFSHIMPAPPGLYGLMVSGIPFGQDCDAHVPVIAEPAVISWQPVRMSHPEIGRPNEPIDVAYYEVVVEQEDLELTVSVLLPSDQTSFTVPAEFLALGEEFKYEVLVREENNNQTATESCFTTQP